jgi:hypothetical protein
LGKYYLLRALPADRRRAAIRRLPAAPRQLPEEKPFCTGFLFALALLGVRGFALDATLLDRVIAILLPASLRISTSDWHCLFPYYDLRRAWGLAFFFPRLAICLAAGRVLDDPGLVLWGFRLTLFALPA